VSTRQHTVIACVLALTCLYALRLSSVEIQPWDEGLYAVRAQSIVLYNNWLDQTDRAIGGLYSSTPPPLVPWAIALFMQVFGPTASAIRVFGVLCSGISLIVLYGIARRMMSFQSAILAVCIVAGCMHWVTYARQAMTEVPLMTFILLSIWSALRLVESTKNRSMWFFAVMAGVGFGAALLTKMTVSFFPLLVFGFLAMRSQRALLPFAVSVVVGLMIAAPWYGTMIAHHGAEFWQALLVPQVTTTVEGNARSLGVLYYVNQLTVAHPVLLAAFAYVLLAVWKRRLLPSSSDNASIITMAWFVLGVIVFSLAPTKNPHYVVMLIPASVLMAVYGIERLLEGGLRRVIVVVYAAVAAATMWSVLPGLRGSLRTLVLDPSMIPFIGIAVLFLVLPFVLPKRIVAELAVRAYRPVVYGACGVMLLRTVMFIAVDPPRMINGGREIAGYLMDSPAHSFGYLYHQHNAGDVYNPQLAWYTAGWMTGWLPGKTVQPYAMSALHADENILAVASASGTPFIVYYHPGQSVDEKRRVAQVLSSSYEIMSTSAEYYTLYAYKHR